jgi:ATP-dependent Clp protease ATP-binding subunit ClpX
MTKHKKHYGIVLEKFGLPEGEEMVRLCKYLFLDPYISPSKVFDLLSSESVDKHKLLAKIESKIKPIKPADLTVPIYEEMKSKMMLWASFFEEPTASEMHEFSTYHATEVHVTNTLIEVVTKSFALTVKNPKDIKTLLDRYVVGQHRAKESICFAFYLHLLRIGVVSPPIIAGTLEESTLKALSLPKPNMMLIGSTGTGKTFMIKTLCKLFDVPFIKIDCASLTSTGYYGKGLNEYMIELHKKLGGDLTTMEKAIIYFDEVDKLSEKYTNKGSVGGIEVQQEFLTFLEDDEIIVDQHKNNSHLNFTLKSKNLMFIFSGSFAGIEEVIEKRLGHTKGIGFGSTAGSVSSKGLLAKIDPQDIITFGMIPELVGRINFVEALDQLTKEDVKNILLHTKDSPLERYTNFFRIHLDELVIEPEVFDMIAEEVLKRGGGGRAINTVLQQLLKDFLYQAPNEIAEKYCISRTYFELRFQ